ncbi:hypothetical protein BJV77DRAFT_968416 [Russula vinacea]|nr:hypothetical protein BJV77DRAFT_968416 [Russula vinacea]
MLVYNLLSVALAFLWSVQAVSSLYIRTSPSPTCTNPVVRREWRTISTDEKADWIRAMNCLSQQPHDPALTPSVDPSISLIPPVNASSSFYDGMTQSIDFTFTDVACFNSFLHRYNVPPHGPEYSDPLDRIFPSLAQVVHTDLENSLKDKCGYTGVSPYWNWTIDAPDFYESSWWKDSDPVSGLGGWGDPNNDYAVPDGGFSNFHISYPSPHTVRRNFTLYPFNVSLSIFTNPLLQGNQSILPSAVEAVLNASVGDFRGFQVPLEALRVHMVARTLSRAAILAEGAPRPHRIARQGSPGHRMMVDKIWYDWQSKDPENVYSFFGGSVQHIENLTSYTQYPSGGPPYLGLESKMPTDGLFPEVAVGEVMNTTGGYLCYVYE